MAHSSRTSSLARQVAELRKLVERHLEAAHPRPVLQIISEKGASEAEIKRLQAEAAAEAGMDPASIDWIHYVVVSPPPRVELPREQITPPFDDKSKIVLNEPAQSWERRLHAVVQEERPVQLYYPKVGVA